MEFDLDYRKNDTSTEEQKEELYVYSGIGL